MGSDFKTLFKVVIIMSLVANLPLMIGAGPQVPCYFIFGDSLIDNGNNKGLQTLAKVNYPPYGIDFPSGPTGRFTNGRTVVDVVAQALGFENFIPPFVTTRGKDILNGVNYASGGAGIRDETGEELGGRFSMNMQLENHRTNVLQIASLLGKSKAANHLSKCIYTVGMGSNDYINNYFLPEYYNTSQKYTPDQYATALIDQYAQQLRILRQYGARKIALFGLGQIGCAPAEIARFTTGTAACVDIINNAVQLFNGRLKSLVDQLHDEFIPAKFVFINVTGITSGDTSQQGITVTNAGCCVVATSLGECIPHQVPCSNRSTYAFWDGFHPTEVVNVLIGTRSYSGMAPFDAYPVNIHLLSLL